MVSHLVRRAKNLAFNSLFIWAGVLFAWAMGWNKAPLSEYLFYYCIGCVIGLPLWVAFDLWMDRRARA